MFKVPCQITGLSIIQIPCLFSSCCLWEVRPKAHGGFHFCRPIMSTPGPISGEWGTRTGVPVSPSWNLPVFTWMWTATGRHRTAMKVFTFSAKNQMVIGYSEGIGNLKFSGINYYTSLLTFITSHVSWVAEDKKSFLGLICSWQGSECLLLSLSSESTVTEFPRKSTAHLLQQSCLRMCTDWAESAMLWTPS